MNRWFALVCSLALVFAAGLFLRGQGLFRPPSHFPASTAAPLHAGDSSDIAAISDIPNVEVAYYDVDATDAAGIRAEMDAKGPSDGKGKRFDGFSNWNYRWHWNAGPDGCGNENVVVDFEARLILPRLTHADALSPQLAGTWKAYMAALTQHQANQIRQAYGGRQWIANEVRNATCEGANAAGTRAAADIQRQIDAYDSSTDHGAIEGAVFKAS